VQFFVIHSLSGVLTILLSSIVQLYGDEPGRRMAIFEAAFVDAYHPVDAPFQEEVRMNT
jgi:hypothetical protein